MHVLLLTEFQPATDAVEITGGVEARTHYLAEALRQRGHRVTVVAGRSTGDRWEYASWASIPRRARFVVPALWRTWRSHADVIDATNFVVHPIGWLCGWLQRRPVVFFYPDVWVGNWRRDFGRIGILGELAERLILRLPVARYITPAPAVRDKLVAQGVDAARVEIIPCGVSAALTSSVREHAGAKDHDVTVLGRLLPYKRVDVVLRAFAAIVRERPEARMTVVGRGPEEVRLRRLAEALGVESNVTFRGFIPAHRDVLDIVARGRLLVTASTLEGFGIVLVEAMALGVPYLASDIPVFRDHGEVGGLLFPAGDVGALATKMSLLLGDDGLRRRMSRAGLERSQRYTWALVAEETEAVYRELLGDRRRRMRRRALPGSRATAPEIVMDEPRRFEDRGR